MKNYFICCFILLLGLFALRDGEGGLAMLLLSVGGIPLGILLSKR